ncbi:HNH endonuclease [Mycetocola reblochoni]|uniref:HNH endonuclease n=1 Tax=Mycetocola reblochoni TaxID=331618 RepID=UPI003F9E46C8
MTRNSRAARELHAELRGLWTLTQPPCWLCGQQIDYDAPAHDPDGLDVDHVKPYLTNRHLALERSNLRPSHVRCNRSRGARPPRPDIGVVTEEW